MFKIGLQRVGNPFSWVNYIWVGRPVIESKLHRGSIIIIVSVWWMVGCVLSDIILDIMQICLLEERIDTM